MTSETNRKEKIWALQEDTLQALWGDSCWGQSLKKESPLIFPLHFSPLSQ